MKKILLIAIFMFGMLHAFTQDYPYYNPMYSRAYNPMHINAGINSLGPNSTKESTKKTDVGVQLGTSFSTDFNRGFAFTTFVAPELRYRVNDRLTIRGGVSLANSEYGNSLMYSPYGYSRYSGNITQGTIYVSGDYVLSPKLILSGTAYKEFSINHRGAETGYNPGYDGKGLKMNLRFMPSENVTIDAGVEIYEGNNPYRSGFYNPYRPFGSHW
jgi:hypothetical protein